MIVDPTLTDYTRDFVKTPRAVLRLLRRDHLALAVYLVLLDRARYVAGPAIHEGQVLNLDAGECLMGRDEMAASISASSAQVRAAKTRLEQLRLITSRTTNRGTIVKLLGYGESTSDAHGESPADDQQNDRRTASRQPADNQQNSRQTTTNREAKKQRRRDDETFSAAADSPPGSVGWKPPSGGKAEAIAAERVARGEIAIADAEACWAYCESEGIHLKRGADAIAAKLIRKQRPEHRSKPNGHSAAERGDDAAYFEEL